VRSLVLLRGLKLYEQQSVIKLDVRIAKFKSFENFATLPKGRSKEITASSALDYGVLQDQAIFQTRQV
jgi:hypothetical protein